MLAGALTLLHCHPNVDRAVSCPQAVVAANLDCVLLEARPALEALPDHLLHELGHLLQAQCGAAPTGDAPPLPPSRLGAPLPDTHRPTAFAGATGGQSQSRVR